MALKARGGGSFKLLLQNGDTLTAAFTDKEEMIVTNALRLHNSVWLKVKGPGKFDDAGKLQHILRLEHCQQVPAPSIHSEEDSPHKDREGKDPAISTGQSILKMFEKIHKSSPEGSWDGVPTDLAENWHYYKYEKKRRKAKD